MYAAVAGHDLMVALGIAVDGGKGGVAMAARRGAARCGSSLQSGNVSRRRREKPRRRGGPKPATPKPPPTREKGRARAESPRPRAGGRRFLVVFGLAAGMAAGVWWLFLREPASPWPAPRAEPAPRVAYEDFVGAEACVECHEEIVDLWRESTHGRAGGHPDSVKLLRPFDGRQIVFRDAVVTPRRTANGEYAFVVERAGEAPVALPVTGVIGGGHMEGGGTQGFVAAGGDGTVRFLPFDYTAGADTWFCNTAGRLNRGWLPITPDLALGDCADWPPFRMLGDFEGVANCQQCHGSQIVLEQVGPGRFRTRYATLAVDCEACHGPNREHVEAEQEKRPASDGGTGVAALEALDERGSIEVCFKCHALKVPLTDEPYLPGDDFREFYSVKLGILVGSPHFPDGRVRTFAYQETHLASDCYVNGRMTCTDCHDPHSQQYRDAFGKPLEGRFDDGQCTVCHPSKAEDPTAHSFHEPDSEGNLCVACHMPYLQHPGVGRAIPYGRSDHAITIPRPALDAPQQIVGACAQCHDDYTQQELEDSTTMWWGELKPLAPRARALMQARAERDRRRASTLVLEADAAPQELAEFGGLSHLFLQRLGPDMPSLEPEIVERLKVFAQDPDDDVAALALASLHMARGNDPAIQRFLADQLRGLGRREVAVRRRWTYILRTQARGAAITGDPGLATILFRKVLEVAPGDREALSLLRR